MRPIHMPAGVLRTPACDQSAEFTYSQACQFDLFVYDVYAVISKLIDQPVWNLVKNDFFYIFII
jgi:hypothetical protein